METAAAAAGVRTGAPAVLAPPLVLLGGAPGSGKTTLALPLAAALGLPLLAKEGLKEVL